MRILFLILMIMIILLEIGIAKMAYENEQLKKQINEVCNE